MSLAECMHVLNIHCDEYDQTLQNVLLYVYCSLYAVVAARSSDTAFCVDLTES